MDELFAPLPETVDPELLEDYLDYLNFLQFSAEAFSLQDWLNYGSTPLPYEWVDIEAGDYTQEQYDRVQSCLLAAAVAEDMDYSIPAI